eukprot:359787-Chlamydomonas_euryale.AAC.3
MAAAAWSRSCRWRRRAQTVSGPWGVDGGGGGSVWARGVSERGWGLCRQQRQPQTASGTKAGTGGRRVGQEVWILQMATSKHKQQLVHRKRRKVADTGCGLCSRTFSETCKTLYACFEVGKGGNGTCTGGGASSEGGGTDGGRDERDEEFPASWVW